MNNLRKPVIKHDKFLNMTQTIWKETNEETKRRRGVSNITMKENVETLI